MLHALENGGAVHLLFALFPLGGRSRANHVGLHKGADGADAIVDELDGVFLHAVAVGLTMHLVEVFHQILNDLFGDLTGRHGNRNLESLTEVAHITGAHQQTVCFGDFLFLQTGDALGIQLGVDLVHDLGVDLLTGQELGVNVVSLDVGQDQTHGAEGAGRIGHDDLFHFQLFRNGTGVHTAAASVAHQCKLTGIVALLDRDQLDGPEHIGVDHLQNTLRRLHDGDTHGLGDVFFDSSAGLFQCVLQIFFKDFGADMTSDQIGIGNGGLGAAATVAHGAGISACGNRANLQRTAAVHIGDGAAACTDEGQVHRGDRDGIAFDMAFGGELDHIVLDQGHVGRSTADVEGDDVLFTHHLGQVIGGNNACNRTRVGHSHRLVSSHVKGHDAGVGLHHIQIGADVGFFHVLFEIHNVRGHVGHHVSVDNGGGGSLIFPELRVDVRRGRNVAFGPDLFQCFLDLLLVLGVGIGVHQADTHRLDILGTEFFHNGGDLVQHQGFGLLALEVHAAGDLKTQITLDQRLRTFHLDIVDVFFTIGTGDLQDILKATGGDEGGGLIFLLGDHIDHDGGAVDQLVDLLVAQTAGFHDLVDAVHDAVHQCLGRGGSLGIIHTAGVHVGQDHVGVGAAGIDTQSIHDTFLRLWVSKLNTFYIFTINPKSNLVKLYVFIYNIAKSLY